MPFARLNNIDAQLEGDAEPPSGAAVPLKICQSSARKASGTSK